MIHMRTISLLILLSGCTAMEPKNIDKNIAATNSAHIGDTTPNYLSIDPRASPWFEKETSTGKKKIFWEDLKNSEANTNLPLEKSFVSVRKMDGSISGSFVSAKYSAEAGKYRTILDYAKFRDDVMGEHETPVRIGVGVRIIADITTVKDNIDLGSLFSIALAAKAGYLQGQIEVLKIGIDSPSFSLVLPPPAELNETSLQNALQAVASIRAKLYDADTKLTPHVLAVLTEKKVD